jgi:hypothetical protein
VNSSSRSSHGFKVFTYTGFAHHFAFLTEWIQHHPHDWQLLATFLFTLRRDDRQGWSEWIHYPPCEKGRELMFLNFGDWNWFWAIPKVYRALLRRYLLSAGLAIVHGGDYRTCL